MLGALGQLGGSFFGGMASNNALNEGKQQAGEMYQQGIDYLKQGNAQQRADFQPYMSAGQSGLGSYQHLLEQGNQATMPGQSGAFSFDQWKDPSAQYTMDQSNKAINASAIAKGAVGGGLGKALQANASNLAGQQYQNAFQRYLAQNQQDFGQQQQIYGNQTQNYQNQVAGYGNLANMGQQAAGTSGNLGLGYANGVNGAYQNWGDTSANVGNSKAQNFGQMGKGIGDSLGGLGKSFFS